jgi:hypothetical protein
MREQRISKLNSAATRSEREGFIRAKYERRAFIRCGDWKDCGNLASQAVDSPGLLEAFDRAFSSQPRAEVNESATRQDALIVAAEAGILPCVLFCLVQTAANSESPVSVAPPLVCASKPSSSPLHVAALHRRWAALYLLVSFLGWSPPGEPDSYGRSVWQAALSALTDPATASSGAAVVPLNPQLLSALAAMLVRAVDRPLAVTSATQTLMIMQETTAKQDQPT